MRWRNAGLFELEHRCLEVRCFPEEGKVVARHGYYHAGESILEATWTHLFSADGSMSADIHVEVDPTLPPLPQKGQQKSGWWADLFNVVMTTAET